MGGVERAVATHFDVAVVALTGTRDMQEDSFAITDCEDTGRPLSEISTLLVAVADGLGGHSAGKQASEIVITSFVEAVQSSFVDAHDMETLLVSSVHTANEAIRHHVAKEPNWKGMASTLVAAVVVGDRAYWVSVGDSHLAVLNRGEYRRLNSPHRLAPTDSTQVGAPTNVLVSCLNGSVIQQIQVSDPAVTLQREDWLILASDGIETIQMERLVRLAQESLTLQDFAERVEVEIESASVVEQDNMTLIAVMPLVSPASLPNGTTAGRPHNV